MPGTHMTDQLVAAVFADHAAGEAAVAKVRQMGSQLAQAGVSGILTVSKSPKGAIATMPVEVSGASDQAEELVARTRRALDALAGGRRDGDAPAAQLGQALVPGALAIGIFVAPDRAEVIEMGVRNLGGQVLSAEELRRIGARLAGVPGNGTLDRDGTGETPAMPPAAAVFDWQAEYAYSLGVQAFIYGFPYVYSAQCRYK